MKKIKLLFLFLPFIGSCKLMPKNENKTASKTQKTGYQVKFYGMAGTDSVFQYIITNIQGMEVGILNYGATITHIIVPDRYGKREDVVLGFDSLNGYLKNGNPYFGCIVGRYANRIANAKFSLDGNTYTLAANNNGNSLHGGLKGFDKVIWTLRGKEVTDEHTTLGFQYNSRDGEEGFPGNMQVTVAYSLLPTQELKIDYIATTDKPTPVNLTNHSYFNLSAGRDSTILDHALKINADQYTEVNEKLIPTGKLIDTKGSTMDFTTAKLIGKDLDKVQGGYDHNWVLNKKTDSLGLAATLYHPFSGRYMEVFTTEPGIQFYSSNFMDGSLTGKKGKKYVKHAALCLETQHYPDSPNQPSFPNTILKPGETYHQTTVYKFSIK